MSDDETTLVLHTFNTTATDFPTEMCMQDLVDAQAKRQPAAIAVEWQRALRAERLLRPEVPDVVGCRKCRAHTRGNLVPGAA